VGHAEQDGCGLPQVCAYSPHQLLPYMDNTPKIEQGREVRPISYGVPFVVMVTSNKLTSGLALPSQRPQRTRPRPCHGPRTGPVDLNSPQFPPIPPQFPAISVLGASRACSELPLEPAVPVLHMFSCPHFSRIPPPGHQRRQGRPGCHMGHRFRPACAETERSQRPRHRGGRNRRL